MGSCKPFCNLAVLDMSFAVNSCLNCSYFTFISTNSKSCMTYPIVPFRVTLSDL